MVVAEKISIDFENCYGINKLKYDFELKNKKFYYICTKWSL